MGYSVRLARITVTVLILIILVFVGCQRSGQSAGTDNSELQIALQPAPQEGTLVVLLTDASGAPITNATVALEGNMNHAGMVPVLADAVSDEADGSADGRYQLPFAMEMLGDWIISVTVNEAGGNSFSRNLEVRVAEDGIHGDNVQPLNSGEISPDSTALHIEKAMARPAPLAGGTGAVYFLLHNGADAPVKWMGADTPAASAAEIHTTENDNGVMRMRQITDGIEIAPGESIELTPGAMHLMLVNLAAPLVEGESVPVTLHFEGTDDLSFDAPVMNIDTITNDGMSDGGEMVHDH